MSNFNHFKNRIWRHEIILSLKTLNEYKQIHNVIVTCSIQPMKLSFNLHHTFGQQTLIQDETFYFSN